MDEKKRLKILSVAAQKFASQPFHKVRLSDVADAAGVGKGTLYTYFKSKDDLYLSVLYSGFTRLLERLRNRMTESTLNSLKTLEMAISQMVQFAYENPHLFELMRTTSLQETFGSPDWGRKRAELRSLLESIIRQGIRQEEFTDAHPDLTARFIPGLVRSVMIEPVPRVGLKTLSAHIFHFVTAAISAEKRK
jgi:AcrR family transcriptional regulator